MSGYEFNTPPDRWTKLAIFCAVFLVLSPLFLTVVEAASNKIPFLLQTQPDIESKTVRVQAILPVNMVLYGNVNGLQKGEALQCVIREEKSRNAQGQEVVVGHYFECNDDRTFRLIKVQFTAQ